MSVCIFAFLHSDHPLHDIFWHDPLPSAQERPCSVPSLPVTRPTSLSSVSQVAFCELDSYTAPGSYKDEEEEEEEVLPPPKKVPSLSLGISPCTA